MFFRVGAICLSNDAVLPIQAEIKGRNKPYRCKTDHYLQSAEQREVKSQAVKEPDANPRADKKSVVEKEQACRLARYRFSADESIEQFLTNQEDQKQMSRNNCEKLPDRKCLDKRSNLAAVEGEHQHKEKVIQNGAHHHQRLLGLADPVICIFLSLRLFLLAVCLSRYECRPAPLNKYLRQHKTYKHTTYSC